MYCTHLSIHHYYVYNEALNIACGYLQQGKLFFQTHGHVPLMMPYFIHYKVNILALTFNSILIVVVSGVF